MIYLDHNATTPVDPEVVSAMLPYFSVEYGNASSRHGMGGRARSAVETARGAIAALVGCEPSDLYFTSGATEANNLVLFGLVLRHKSRIGRPHIISLGIEHSSVLEPLKALESEGVDVELLAVDSEGRIDPRRIEQAIRPETLLVSIGHANGEIGTIQPIEEIAARIKRPGLYFHVDGAQAVGKIPVNLARSPVHFYTFSAHKMYGPKGIGALVVRGKPDRPRLAPLLLGGGQERSVRPGTLNVPALVGFGVAAEIANQRLLNGGLSKMATLREELWVALSTHPRVVRNSPLSGLLPNTLNVSLLGFDAESVLSALPSLAASTGSACRSHTREPSHVISAITTDPERAQGAVRLTLGVSTRGDEIEAASRMILTALEEGIERTPEPLTRSAKSDTVSLN